MANGSEAQSIHRPCDRYTRNFGSWVVLAEFQIKVIRGECPGSFKLRSPLNATTGAKDPVWAGLRPIVDCRWRCGFAGLSQQFLAH